MTGFVFTFSLLCTAALQADPAVLQRPEAAILRPLLEAALPAAHLTSARGSELRVHPVCTRRSTSEEGIDTYRTTFLCREYRAPVPPLRRHRPIRAPTCC
ncbi:hypothetical protein KQI65_05775 [bacterium]|nr:hypothetical protein [bacterium]